MTKNKYQWAATGDVNAFFGLMLDNIADLLLTVSLLAAVFEFPTEFALRYMVPGTAIGVFVGDLLFFIMAIRFARQTRRRDVTAMPLGLDTPSTFGMVFFVLGPAFLAAKASGLSEFEAAHKTWEIGICSIVISGIFKFCCAFGSNWIRKVVPRAGLLGSLAAIALVLISFLPMLEVLHFPIVGFIALALILTTLVARIRLPFHIPGALGALIVAGTIYYLMQFADSVLGTHLLHAASPPAVDRFAGLLPYEWTEVFRFQWLGSLGDAVQYLPIVIPFALGTVVGGIDCTESAAAVGDEFDTGQVIGVEAIATFIAGCCGGVIQTTPYIGHPAYKAMGGRAAYTLATAIFVGSAGLLGYFGFLYFYIPKATVFPILIFIGLEITSQSFQATPRRHYSAIVLGCIPALASLVMVIVGDLQGQYSGKVASLENNLQSIVAQQEEVDPSQLLTQLKTETTETFASRSESNAYQSLIAAIDQAEESLSLEDLQSVEAASTQLVVSTASDEGSASQSLGTDELHDYIVRQSLIVDLESLQRTTQKPDGPLGTNMIILHLLAGGFIVTSLCWSSGLAMIVDRRLFAGAGFFALTAIFSLFGIIHSPLPSGGMYLPWQLAAEDRMWVLEFAFGYLGVAAVLIAIAYWIQRFKIHVPPVEDDQEHVSAAMASGDASNSTSSEEAKSDNANS